jgi:hypothetical protein
VTRAQALQQSIADLEYIRAHPGNIDVLLEKRRADLREADATWSVDDENAGADDREGRPDRIAQEFESTSKTTVDRYQLNDTLTAYTFEIGVRLEDEDLNELTHTVADFLETKGQEFS